MRWANSPFRWDGRRVAGITLLALLLSFCGLEALFGSSDPFVQDLDRTLAAPSWGEPLGTDHFGRSMLARIASATRLSLGLAALCSLSSASIGVALGVVAGWAGGWVDRTLSFMVNVLLALPGLMLILLFAALAPGSLVMLYWAISLVLWVEYFRVTRAETQRAVKSPQLEASRSLGFGRFYCFRRHVWPTLLPNVATLAAFGAATSILALAAVGFVYVGLKPPVAELGLMMVELFPYYSDAPWILLQPTAVVFLLVLAFNLLAGGKSA